MARLLCAGPQAGRPYALRAAVPRCSLQTPGPQHQAANPAVQFARLAAVFRRRLLVGLSTASLVAIGSNFGGVTSFLLDFLAPEVSRSLRLDVIYPVNGFSRCLDPVHGFEFIYPSNWVADQTLFYREINRAEAQRPLDLPPLDKRNASPKTGRSVNEPVVAFGPPGSNGDLNVSVIVSTVPRDFSIEAFGGPKEVGEAVLERIAKTRRATDVKVSLIDATMRKDAVRKVRYYILEFGVEGHSFRRHNVAVCCSRDGQLYTLNAQVPESAWPLVKGQVLEMADSFNLTET